MHLIDQAQERTDPKSTSARAYTKQEERETMPHSVVSMHAQQAQETWLAVPMHAEETLSEGAVGCSQPAVVQYSYCYSCLMHPACTHAVQHSHTLGFLLRPGGGSCAAYTIKHKIYLSSTHMTPDSIPSNRVLVDWEMDNVTTEPEDAALKGRVLACLSRLRVALRRVDPQEDSSAHDTATAVVTAE